MVAQLFKGWQTLDFEPSCPPEKASWTICPDPAAGRTFPLHHRTWRRLSSIGSNSAAGTTLGGTSGTRT